MILAKLRSRYWQPAKQKLASRIRNALAIPPGLPRQFTQADFSRFMREETFRYSRRYARKRVVVHGGEHLTALAKQSGGILACLHFGSFFLSGGAVVRQLKLPYTAVVTSRNHQVMPAEEAAFWVGVHRRAEKLYGQRLFSTADSPRTFLKWLATPGHMLGIVLDVREHGYPIKEYPFVFLGHPIHMQAGPAKLACLARVPLIPMTISYDEVEKRHHLYFDAPIPPGDPVAMTQQALSVLEKYVAESPAQLFNDIVVNFAQPQPKA